MRLNKHILYKVLPYFLSNYIKFVHATNSWTHLNTNKVKKFWDEKRPFIWIHWHGQSLMLPNSWNYQEQKLYALVSLHGDGEIIANTLSNLGLNLVRGAGNPDKLGLKEKGGTAALRSMIKILKNGDSVAFTADQPPGPGKIAGNGSIVLSKISGSPIIPVAASTSRRYQFNNWDKFTINFPFGKGVVVWGDPIFVKKDSSDNDIDGYSDLLQDSLNKASKKAKEFLEQN